MRKHPHIAATIGRTDRCAEHPPPEQVGTIGDVEAADAEAAEIEASGATDGGAGKYIVFEGAEGSGKSTQAARLATTLDAVLTRETGGTDIGARLRAILHDTTNAHLDDRAEALLAAADRAQHLTEVVRPALDAGRFVVSDRSVYSSLAYQGYGRGLDVADIAKLNEWATAGRWPDRVIFLDTPDDVVAERMSRRDLDRFESEGEAFHQRVLDGYRTMAAADPDRWITVQAIGSIDRVAAQIRAALAEHGVVIDE